MHVKSTGVREKVATLDGSEVWSDKKYMNRDHALDHWKGMPDFVSKSPEAIAGVRIDFENDEDMAAFAKLIEQDFVNTQSYTKSLWYPPKSKEPTGTLRFISDRKPEHMPRYPFYIPSKGRWEKRLTSDTLIALGIKHYMIVEESQLKQYQEHTDPNWVTLLVLPQKYFDEYETCDDLGATRSRGPGPARNFAWDHSISMGYKRHWVSDDNCKGFARMWENRRPWVDDGAIFRAMEDHADQFENVYMSGPNYRFFAVPGDHVYPFALNTRIYSTNLILNDIPFRWRGRYNEDTILSLDILKAGHCTIQYYAFLSGKLVTQTLGGGNTAEFYNKEGTLPKSKMLEDVHPDVAKVEWKFGRWHHTVNYAPFRNNRLIPAKDPYPMAKDHNYGMKLVQLDTPKVG